MRQPSLTGGRGARDATLLPRGAVGAIGHVAGVDLSARASAVDHTWLVASRADVCSSTNNLIFPSY